MGIPELIFDASLTFQEKMEAVLAFQRENNPVYALFYDILARRRTGSKDQAAVPLIPARAFREHVMICDGMQATLTFRSSGTTAMERSIHPVADPDIYRQSIHQGFDRFYQPESIVWAYTPGYSDNSESSLMWMFKALIERDSSGLSRLFDDTNSLKKEALEAVEASGRPLILFGAAFGLLELAENGPNPLPEGTIILETGGMKTHKRAIDKPELRQRLSDGFKLPLRAVQSEYGMCELLSQAYATDGEWFETVPWMQVTVRDPDDPSRICDPGEEGKIGIIDLANCYSCPFLLTEDRGVADNTGRFQVLGRWRPDDMRGCNFLIDSD